MPDNELIKGGMAMRSPHALRGLLALNAALLILLGAVTFGASVQGQARNRGEYTMVTGDVPGSDSSAIYIADVANQELVAMIYNPNTKVLDGVGYRNLAADGASIVHGRTSPRN